MRRESLARLVPPEGWLTVGLVYLMGLSVAWAIDDARWFLGEETILDFLQSAVIGGITISLVAARAGWGRWTGHLVGAMFAAVLLPLWIGERLPHPLDAPLDRVYSLTAEQFVAAGFELAERGRVLVNQFGPTLLLFGIIVWGTGMFASTAVFRHHRPLAAIAALGILLLVNISATPFDQLGYLVLYSGASLLLLVRLHAVDEQVNWVRGRLGDPRPVRSHTLRAGTAFVLAAIVGSFALTQTASSAPLATAWPEGLEDGIVEVGKELSNLFPFFTSVRGPGGADFGVSATITGFWPGDEGVAFTAALPANTPESLYWRAAAYDSFDPDTRTWRPASEAPVTVPAGEPLLPLIADPIVTKASQDIPATITPASRDRVAFAPGLPVEFDQRTDVITSEPTGSLVRVFLSQRGIPYEVTATRLVPEDLTHPDGVSANKLAAIDRADYPTSVLAQYAVPDEVLGPASRAFVAGIKADVGPAPYRIAARMEQRFRDEFEYRADVSTIDCRSLGFVECFMVPEHRAGYCMYFATAMIELLRDDGIPARLVMGYLPGERATAPDKTIAETVGREQAHAWVEVYFPGWGWVPFDPTATRAQLDSLAPGRPVPSPSPGARASLPPSDIKDPERRPRTPAFGTPGTAAGGVPAPLLVAGVVLVVVVGVTSLLIVRVRIRRRRDVGVAEAYRGVVGIASRLGYGPRPSQTIYEYADSLGQLVPIARTDLRTVADARVETTYGRRQLGADRLAAVAAAASRLRVSLLRLFFRRGRSGGSRVLRPPRR